MNNGVIKITSNKIQNRKYFFVLLSLFNFLLTPIHSMIFNSIPSLVVVINFTLVILAGLPICKSYKHKFVYYITATITLIIIWLEFGSSPRTIIHFFRLFSSFLFFSFLCYLMIKNLIESKYFDLQSILGAVAGYLFVGLIGGIVFEFIDTVLPNSFNHGPAVGGYVYYYFSFISITTIGFGDITPITPQAQSTTLVLSIIGQFYLTIVVALFVGKFINKK